KISRLSLPLDPSGYGANPEPPVPEHVPMTPEENAAMLALLDRETSEL
ncbi:unnamed protein product, partial [marine sediment metagenome]